MQFMRRRINAQIYKKSGKFLEEEVNGFALLSTPCALWIIERYAGLLGA